MAILDQTQDDAHRRFALAIAEELGINPSQIKDRSLRFVTNYDDGRTCIEWDGIAFLDDEQVIAIWNEAHRDRG